MIRYGVGALATLASSIGIALIVYGGGFVEFDVVNALSWIFGPLGTYTLVYGVLSHKDSVFYSIWGVIMLGVAVSSAFYRLINPLVVLGILVIIVVILGLVIRGGARK